MTSLVLNLLGAFEVTAATTSPTGRTFATDKVRGLLAYLALEPAQAHRRETLAAIFWPEINHQSALTNLRQTFHRLRDGLERVAPGSSDALFTVTKQTLQLNQTALTVDAIRFTTLLAASERHAHADLATCEACLERLGQAIALYRGELLTGFGLGDAAPFEEWLLLRRELYQQQALLALQKLTDAHEQQSDYDQAHTYASRQLALDPYREEAHRQLMRLLALRGLTSQALTQYERCLQILRDELGVPPADETIQLMAQIRTGRLEQKTRRAEDKKTERKEGTGNGGSIVSTPASPSSGLPVFLSSALPTIPHNLPAHLTPLIGREAAVAEVSERLQQGAVRLLSIVGTGGMGKTRLALAVAQQLRMVDGYAPDGFFFVSLAALSDVTAIAPAIADTLGVQVQGNPQGALLRVLRDKRMLLILDNFEHLLEGAALVVELLQTAAALRIITTSRERLNVQGESLYQIPALAFDEPQQTKPTAILSPDNPLPQDALDRIARLSAVQLFTQCTQRIQADFQLTSENAADVLRICRLLQGAPLGLELATAWVGMLPLRDIAQSISQSYDFLTAARRDVPARQQSMRAVFEWSWRLLTAEEQQVLRRLSLFRGGFTRLAAQSITGATLMILARLVQKSLVQWEEGEAQSTGGSSAGGSSAGGRYRLHELLRQFAATALSQHPADEQTMQQVYSRFYLTYLAERTPRLVRRELKEASSEIQAELDNIRQAWKWAGVQGEIASIDQAAYGWWQFCSRHGLITELGQSLVQVIEQVRSHLAAPGRPLTAPQQHTAQRLLSKLLAIHANSLFAQGVGEEMAAEAKEAIALDEASGGVEGQSLAYFVMGRVYQELEKREEATHQWQTAIAFSQKEQQRALANHITPSLLVCDIEWMAHLWLRGTALASVDYAGGRDHARQALQICQRHGNQRGELTCLINVAWNDIMVGDYAAAQKRFSEGFALACTVGHRWGEMGTGIGLSEVARRQGHYLQALTWLQRSLRIAIGFNVYDEAMLLCMITRIYCYLGAQEEVERWYNRLSPLMMQNKLPKECQRQALLVAAIKAYYADNLPLALSYAEQAHQLNVSGEIITERADLLLIRGHALAGLTQWSAASTSYQEALAYHRKVGNLAAACEARAGLAHIALAQGQPLQAQTEVEAILSVLTEQPYVGLNGPYFIYLTCYRVLAANHDARTAAILQQGQQRLAHDAAQIDDDRLRRSFMEGVRLHQVLAKAADRADAGKPFLAGG